MRRPPVRRSAGAKVVLGLDTRESSGWIGETIARGLRDAGCGFASAGVLTTPGVAYLTRTHGFAAGVVISASHNPWQDNGIKLFGRNGMKLADEIEHEIEADIFEHIDQLTAHQPDEGSLMADILPGCAALRADYEAWLASSVDATAKPLRHPRPHRLRQRSRQRHRSRTLRPPRHPRRSPAHLTQRPQH